ncbi:MAG: hypothetical protein D6680_05200 [Cyanobacteria bacterium J007]|nr:MAG: hypothetical protein D6680_05200 [Cyanobacteria bacterium J007]
MTALNRSTRRRLQQLPQIPSVWEGDRRTLTHPLPVSSDSQIDLEPESGGDCILWVDGSQGIVRAMDVVTPETGHQAIVRTLLRAIEHPHSPAHPARPQKIVVKDREIQFFLRGVLQDLDIAIEYVPDLPLIDEIFQGFQEAIETKPPSLPPQYAEVLLDKARDLWDLAPWESLGDHQILAIELGAWDLDTLYACTMGMLGLDYGILFYRSLDSLQRFRQRAIEHESTELLEEAFLSQDCLFLTFETDDDENDRQTLGDLDADEIEPRFGNLHPFEGMRSILYDEEALAVLVALDAFGRFFRQFRDRFARGEFPSLSAQYQIPLPEGAPSPNNPLPVKVDTLPEIATDLYQMAAGEEDEEEEDEDEPILRDDLVPKNSFLSLGVIPWDTLTLLREEVNHYQSAPVESKGEGLPIILIQTSRPKAKTMIETLQNSGGVRGIGFNPGEDPLEGDLYDLGILQTEDDTLYLFGEFEQDDPTHMSARQKWDRRCKQTKGYCGLVIAMGLTGSSRGNPQLKDMMGLFEVRSLSSKELDLGTLQLIATLL